jgi:putative adhesin
MKLERTLWKAAIGLVLVPAALCAAEGSFEKTLKVTGPVELEVATGSGNIEVRSGSAGTVWVRGKIKSSSGWFDGDAESKVRALESNPPISQVGNYIRIGKIEDRELARNVSISYVIETPADTELKSNTGSGSQVVSGIQGPVAAMTGSGSLKISDIKATARTRSGSGTIELEAIQGHVFADTGSGTILGEDLGGGVEGGTGSGDIHLRLSGAGPVRLRTGSGDVDVQGVNGSLSVQTGSGDIKAEGEAAGDWAAHTGSGSVTVRLPSAASFDILCRTSSGHIDSAHAITVQGTIGKGQMRGKVGKGGVLVDLQTASGNIHIE